MSRKCECCDALDDLSYDVEAEGYYCTYCAAEKHYDEHVCYCDPDNEYAECMPCATGQRPHNPRWD